VESYDLAHIISYEGPEKTPKEMILDILLSKKFDDDEMKGMFD
jgi:hypothetical protein